MNPPPASDAPVSVKSPAVTNAGCGYLFGGLFVLIGLVAFVFTFVVPVIHILGAQSWPATPCKILGTSIKSHSGKHTTYSCEVNYTYTVGSGVYFSDRWSFANKGSGSYSSATATQASYPSGMATVCYVDPANPQVAVLNKGFNAEVASGLVPLLFSLVGGLLIWGMKFGTRNAAASKVSWRPQSGPAVDAGPGAGRPAAVPVSTSPFDSPFSNLNATAPAPAGGSMSSRAPAPAGPLVLRPLGGPLVARAFGLLAIAAFWDGMVGVGGSAFVHGFRGSLLVIFPVLFFIPFFLIGLGLTLAAIGSFLALGNARPTVTLSRSTVRPGESIDITWQLGGGFFRPREINVGVEGREMATYRRGTSTYTDKSLFFQKSLYGNGESSLGQTATASHGTVRLEIPAAMMHSFESQNNKLIYVVMLHGPLPLWPDIKEEFKFVVDPAPAR